jgi:hypothetical protein
MTPAGQHPGSRLERAGAEAAKRGRLSLSSRAAVRRGRRPVEH